MKTRIVRIGNSQGIRIPKLLLDQSGLAGEVELEVQHRQIIIRSAHLPRAGWAEAFLSMAKRGDDALLDSQAFASEEWDEDEWTW